MADMRKCIGSAKFRIEAHEAPIDDFPAQPSQKDVLGRMCKPHWKAYVAALTKARAAVAQAASTGPLPAHEVVRISSQQRRAEAQAAGKVPAADGSVPEPTVGQKLARLNAERKASAKAARTGIRNGAKAPKKPEPIRTRPAKPARTVLGGSLPTAISEAIDEAQHAAEAIADGTVD